MAVASGSDLFGLSPAHARLRADAREAAAAFAGRAPEVRRHLLDHREMHPELWAVFRERGWPGLVTTGGGDGPLGMALVLESFAEQGIVLWLPVLSSALAHAIARVGPDRARRSWLERTARGEALLGMAATEPHSGHNLFGVRTEIRRDGDHFVVNGLKRVASGLDVVDRVLVFGRAQDGYTTVLVDPRAPGATLTELPMRYREGVRQFELGLDGVVVPLDGLVGAEGRGLDAMWPFANVERVLTAAVCLGSAAYSVGRSVARARERTISGGLPIGAEQAIAHPLAGLYARLEAVRLFVHRTAARFDPDDDGADLAGAANMAKLLTADLAFDAADHAMQVMGADAWDEREGWLDTYLDARLSRSGPVSNEFALNYIARHVLGLPAHR
jgi:acyl-CoA dehydrogenase